MGIRLKKLKIYFRKCYDPYNDLVQHYNTTLSQFVCDLVLVLVHGFNPIGYELLYSWFHGVLRDHIMRSLLFPDTYSHTWVFSSVRVVLSVHLFPALSWLWTNDIWLTDDGRLFPSILSTLVHRVWHCCQRIYLYHEHLWNQCTKKQL